jgi:hypothetical protein
VRVGCTALTGGRGRGGAQDRAAKASQDAEQQEARWKARGKELRESRVHVTPEGKLRIEGVELEPEEESAAEDELFAGMNTLQNPAYKSPDKSVKQTKTLEQALLEQEISKCGPPAVLPSHPSRPCPRSAPSSLPSPPLCPCSAAQCSCSIRVPLGPRSPPPPDRPRRGSEGTGKVRGASVVMCRWGRPIGQFRVPRRREN